MCTALVVREEYWDRQLITFAKIRGIDVNFNKDTLRELKVALVDVGTRMIHCLREVLLEISEAFGKVVVIIKDSLLETMEAISKCFKSCEITSDDDFDVVCDKLENRMVYLNRQNCIKQEQYYKAQFKLAKVNYNIMNHDRRC